MPDNETIDLGATRPLETRRTLRPEPAEAQDFAAFVERIRQGKAPLEVGRTLGEGGVGVVRLARQGSLGREVAAKQVKASAPGSARERRLLHEAWVLGGLEHPNIVPVHDVTVDPEGRLTLLMKRVEGETWARWIEDPDGLARTFGAQDVLGWHLGVLTQVCHAVAFAHDRGVIHRDLKPENVMIGRFGEVVVLDWGIAVAAPGAASAPPAVARQVAGTPAYMAPEMWTRPEAASPATDVYLLGGMLFEVLTGGPPHPTGNPDPSRPPPLRSDVPGDLAALASACLDPDPTARPPSAEAVRQRIAAFERHRGSLALTSEADARGARWLADPAHPERLLDEARFGYKAALAQWPDNVRAREGLVRLLERAATHRLAAGDPRAAARLLDELGADVPSELRDDVARAIAEEERVAAIGRRVDPAVGARGRAAMISFLAAIWLAIPIVGHVALAGRPPTRLTVYGSAVALLVVTAAGVLWARGSIRRSAISRQLVGWVLLTPVLQAVQALGLDLLGADVQAMQSAQFFLWGTMCAAAAVAVDRRIAVGAVAYLVAYLVAVRAPEARYLIMLGPNALLAAVVLWIYRDAARRGAD
jgi:hypothetical protein